MRPRFRAPWQRFVRWFFSMGREEVEGDDYIYDGVGPIRAGDYGW